MFWVSCFWSPVSHPERLLKITVSCSMQYPTDTVHDGERCFCQKAMGKPPFLYSAGELVLIWSHFIHHSYNIDVCVVVFNSDKKKSLLCTGKSGCVLSAVNTLVEGVGVAQWEHYGPNLWAASACL